jgi:hypothetical protein
VPDVQGLPYVFAKGVLEDAGFAWKVVGDVDGYAVNVVADQSVRAGTEVLDTGAPIIELRLAESPSYETRGLPEDRSPYKGTELVVAADGVTLTDWLAKQEVEAAAAEEGAAPSNGAEPTDDAAEPAPADTVPLLTDPAVTVPPVEQPTASVPVEPEPTAETTEVAPETTDAAREPDFVVEGAPTEPVDELALPARAKKLLVWAKDLDKATAEALDHYSYQHSWLVSGARFGWWHGAEALEILIQVDELMQKRFDLGRDAEKVARSALAEVRAKAQ